MVMHNFHGICFFIPRLNLPSFLPSPTSSADLVCNQFSSGLLPTAEGFLAWVSGGWFLRKLLLDFRVNTVKVDLNDAARLGWMYVVWFVLVGLESL